MARASGIIPGAKTAQEERRRMQSILRSDRALNAYAAYIRKPLVRASTYGNRCTYYLEFWGWDRMDQRRPVRMHGSRGELVRKYSRSTSNECANGWCYEVALRYLRKQKFTCFDRLTSTVVIKILCRNFHRNYGSTTRHLVKNLHDLVCSKTSCWVRGQHHPHVDAAAVLYLRKHHESLSDEDVWNIAGTFRIDAPANQDAEAEWKRRISEWAGGIEGNL